MITDTIKVCYDAHYYYSDTTASCYHCDSMIYSQIEGDWILYNNKRKKCFGVHHNGNILIKMNGTIVQVNEEKIKTYA